MAGARRRLNYTGRQRIRRESIEIRLPQSGPGEPLKAQVELNLTDYNFPETAKIILEAYHSSSGMRFDLGTAGAPDIPTDLVLTEVDHIGNVNFRLKVIDASEKNGRVLGSAERLQAKSNDDEENGRRSLMTVLFRDLGDEIWRVDVAPDSRPALVVNQTIPDIKHRLRHDAVIQAFLLPAALRFVLENLFRDDYSADDEDETWQKDWREFCSDELGVPVEKFADIESRNEWVDQCIRLFCRNSGFLKNIKKQMLGT